MIKKTTTLFVAITSTLFSTTQALADNHKWEVTGGLGYQWFDSDRNLDNSENFHLGAGYVLNPTWTIEGIFSTLSTEADGNSNIDVDRDYYHLDALYHFKKNGNWQPYAVFGAGHADYSPDRNKDYEETLINAGVGVKTALSDNWVARGDVRLLNSLDEEDIDYGINLSLSYLFGKTSQPEQQTMADADNDGVEDNKDQCPNTPSGVEVNAQGCPLDSDGDGVYDYQDECPDTASNLQVDSKGCPKTLSETVTIQLEVNFASDSAVVREQDYGEIKDLADFMNQYRGTSVIVEGHTDNSGAASYNEGLSQRRADAVREVLISKMGIEAGRVTAKGYGESQPIADNSTSEGRLQNRRVIAKVSSKKTTNLTK